MEDAKNNKGKPVESRTLTAILSGLNRALPFAPPLTEEEQKKGGQDSKETLDNADAKSAAGTRKLPHMHPK